MKLSQALTLVLTSVIITIAVAFFLFAPKGATFTSAPAHKETAYERVMRTRTIRCGYATSPPVLVRDPNTGKISGLDVDIWEQIGLQLGLKIEWVEEAGWGNFIEGMRTGRYDAFCSLVWPDEARSKFLSLSIPVMYTFLSTFVRANDNRFSGNLEEFNSPDITIPAVDGDITVMMAKSKFPKAKILSLPQTATAWDMFQSVASRKADVVFLDRPMIETISKNNPGLLKELKTPEPPFTFTSHCSFNVGEFALRDMVDVALRTMIDDGRMEEMAKRYSPDYIVARKNFEEVRR